MNLKLRLNPVYYLARVTGTAWVPRLAVLGVVALLLMGGGMAAAFVATTSGNWVSGDDEPRRVQVAEAAMDSDEDGLPDALENRIGSDPENPSTLGGGVLDGWLFQWYGEGVDWTDPGFLEARALVAPMEFLPEPLQGRGKIVYPSIQELYHLDREWRDPDNETRLWWFESVRLDPLQWDNRGDSVADAWLIQYGLDPLMVDVDEPAPGDPELSIREKYEAGLNPLLRDSVGNGLPDSAELRGVARFADMEVRFEPTDPTRFSSRGDGIPDGFIVRFGLDPHDDEVGGLMLVEDGLSVREAHEATREHCLGRITGQGDAHLMDSGLDEQPRCDWLMRLQEGPLVDPRVWDSLGDGVPDAWSLRDPEGLAHPLINATTVEVYSTQDWDENPWDGDPEDLFGVVVDELNPVPEQPFVLSLYDLYAYQRPGTWDEQQMGPWWGGLPTRLEAPEGALPPAVALRGWTIQIDTELGRAPEREPEPDSPHLVLMNVTADPRKSDTDGDGLTDLEEYYGVARAQVHGFRTDPGDPDTAGSGLTDCQEILHLDRLECEDPDFGGPFMRGCTVDGSFCLDPLRRDTSGSFLTDGYEYTYWTNRAEEARSTGGDRSGLDPEDLGPLGDIDADGLPNILDRDSDGDSLPDGMELYPSSFLPQAGGLPRPATDPAMRDTDLDDLPDPWEVEWSQEHHHDCNPPCRLPDNTELRSGGWPLDPSHRVSLLGDGVDLGTDRETDYSGGHVTTWSPSGERGSREFSNFLAYKYGLNPYDQFTDSSDGIPDMFAIHWGVEQVPGFLEPVVEADPEFGWTRDAAGDMAARIADRDQLTREDISLEQEHVDGLVVLDPAGSNGEITDGTNLLGYFTDRLKGTWVLVEVEGSEQEVQAQCDGEEYALSLPTTGPRRETGVPLNPDQPGAVFPERSGEAFVLDPSWGFCWEWIEYPLEVDILRGTNPWSHDSAGNGLPDAWEWYYLGANRTSADRVLDSSVASGCRNVTIQGVDDPCLTYEDAYRHGLNPLLADTDDGGLPDWFELALDPPLNPLNPLDDRGEEDWSGNGLPNVVELALGLNPFAPDTAGSGLLDGGDLSPQNLGQDRLEELEERLGEKGVELFPFFDSTTGNGNLCLRRGEDPVANMENRPNIGHPVSREGGLTMSELFDWYVDLGIVHDRNPGGRCPNPEVDGTDGETYPFVLFFRESVRPPDEGRGWTGAGTGGGGVSDSLRRDTSGDGVPDGWLVYWREQAPQFDAAFSPVTHTDCAPGVSRNVCDPDGDFVSTPVEHGGPNVALGDDQGTLSWLAPADWDEDRDGVWWGGTDPTRRWTTLTPSEWFMEPLSDRTFFDFDNDGIPDRYDPFPGVDHYNEGLIRWVPDCPRMGYEDEGCYVTNYSRLWDALQERRDSHLWDDDGDRVPNLLDRVRVRIDLEEVMLPEPEVGRDRVLLHKGGDAVEVRAVVRVDEPLPEDCESYGDCEGYADQRLLGDRGGTPVGDGAGVGNVSVKAFLRDVDGAEALVGANFTDPEGRFRMMIQVSDGVALDGCPEQGGSVGGALCLDSTMAPVLGSTGLGLQPGPLELRFEVEANDPVLQPLWFNNTDGGVASPYATAFKAASSEQPYFVPDGRGPGSGHSASHVALNEEGTARSSSLMKVMHVANATFPYSSQWVDHFLLLAQTELRFLEEMQDAVLLGEDLEVSGVILDAEQEVPLTAGYNVRLEVLRGSEVLESRMVETDSSGVFTTEFSTGGGAGLQAGPVMVRAWIELSEDQQEVLEAPEEPVEVGVVIRRDTSWFDPVINGVGVPGGTTFEHKASEGLVLEALLVDHQDPPRAVGGLDADWRIVGLDGQGDEVVVVSGSTVTDPDGWVVVEIGSIPEGLLLGELRLELNADTVSGSDSPDQYEVLLRPIHETRIVGLEDVRVDAGRVGVVEGQVVRADGVGVFDADASILARSGGMVVEGSSLNATGHFRVHVLEEGPRHSVWDVEFAPGHDQLLGSSAEVNTTHATGARFVVDEVRSLRDEPVLVEGRLVRPDGSGLGNVVVSGAWADRDDDGSFVDVRTSGAGAFAFLLPPRGVGEHGVELRFEGSLTAYPADRVTEVWVVEPTVLELHAKEVVVRDDNTTVPDRFITGSLMDGEGGPLGNRMVVVEVGDSAGGTASVEVMTDPDSGGFGVGLDELGAIAPGEWSVVVQYEGALLEASNVSSAEASAVHEVGLVLSRVPGEVRAGSEFVVHGALGQTPGGFVGEVPIGLLLDGVRVADAVAVPGGSWQARLVMPAGEPGGLELNAMGEPEQGFVRVEEVREPVLRVHGVTVSIEEEVSVEGVRSLGLRAVDSGSGEAVGDVSLVLVRFVEGRVVDTYEVELDHQGEGVLSLRAGARGNVEVVSVLHDAYRLDVQDHQVSTAAPSGGDGFGWGVLGFVFAMLAALVVGVAFVLWRRRQRSSLAEAFEQAHRLLIDPRASPARVIEAVYGKLLLVLEEAGEVIREEYTVRDVSERASRAFSLPQGPMQELTVLIELVKYSQSELGAEDRDRAVHALRGLVERLGSPLQIEALGRSHGESTRVGGVAS